MNICTWIYCDEEQGDQEAREARWKCAAAFFATSFRQNPQATHILFTNTAVIPAIRGFDLGKLLIEQLRVRVERVPLTYLAPFGFHGMKKRPAYLFDVIRRMAEREAEDHDKYVLMDPACVWIRPASIVNSQLERYGLLTMGVEETPEGAAPEPAVAGFARKRTTIREIYEEMLGAPVSQPPAGYGSECFAATVPELRRAAAELDGVWQSSIRRFRLNRPRLGDEAAMLSFIYYKLGYRSHTANPFIKKIRTPLRGTGNAARDDLFLTVWHLPGEVDSGFSRLFRDVIRPGSVFWQARPDLFRKYVARLMGIPRRSGAKYMRDVRQLVSRKLLHSNS